MKNILLISILLLFSFGIKAQVLTITDEFTKAPAEMVSISSVKPDVYANTNARGQADISDFKGSERIEFRLLGYKTVSYSYAQLQNVNFKISIVPSTKQFDEIVISATRWKQPATNSPSKITIISPADVALFNPQTAADLLGSSGEVFIQKSQQGGGSPMIRGFSTNRLLYSVDGIRMNSAIFRSGNLQNVISLDAFSIESTEVLFGPGSILYGSDAIGGVMSFQTLTPQFSYDEKPLITGKAVSRYASANGENTLHADFNIGWKKWASVTSFTHSKFGDLRMGTNGPDEYLRRFYVQRQDSVDRVVENTNPLVQNPTGYDQINMMQKIRFQPNNKLDFQYAFHFSETSSYSRYDRLIETQNNGLPSSAVWNYGPQIWMMNQLTTTYKNDSKLFDRFSLRLAHQQFEESRIDRRFNNHRLRTNLEEVTAYSANLDFEKSLGKHRFYYGAEYVINDVVSTGSAIDIRDNSSILVPDRYPASTWNSYAAYINYQFNINEKITLQSGVRYNGFDIQSDFTRHLEFFPFEFTSSNISNAATTGSVGVVYRPNEKWKISINGSTGFRAPNVDDIGKIFDFSDGEIVVPNTSLEAEYAYNGEINISKIFGENVKLDLTGFYTYLDNAMVRRPFTVNGQDSIVYDDALSQVFAIQNAAFATVYGFNAGIEINLPQGFEISSRYNYQLGEEEMDDGVTSRSRHAAPAFGMTSLTYQREKLTLQFYVMYNAEVSFENLNPEEQLKEVIYAQDSNGNPYSPSWYTVNMKAMYQFHTNFSISGGVENITDQRYRPYSSGLVAPGRNAVLALRVNF
jgi:hemoglobin/transferrin/lactoferrin receptor protein